MCHAQREQRVPIGIFLTDQAAAECLTQGIFPNKKAEADVHFGGKRIVCLQPKGVVCLYVALLGTCRDSVTGKKKRNN